MQYNFSFQQDLHEKLDAWYKTGDIDPKRRNSTTLLKFILLRSMLGSPISRWRPLLVQIAKNLEREEASLQDCLEIAAAAELFRYTHYEQLSELQTLVATTINDAGQHPYLLPLAYDGALAVAMLGGKKEAIVSWREARLTKGGVPGSGLFVIELLYLSQRLLRGMKLDNNFSHHAAYVSYKALSERVDFMGLSVTAIAAAVRERNLSIPELLNSGLEQIDQDLFRDGPEEPARIATSEPSWSVVKLRKELPFIEVRAIVTGTGGRIIAVSPILEPLVYDFPASLEDLLNEDMPIRNIQAARSRAEIKDLLANPAAKLRAVLELTDDLTINAEDLAPFRDRFEVGIEWVRRRFPDFQCQAELIVEHS